MWAQVERLRSERTKIILVPMQWVHGTGWKEPVPRACEVLRRGSRPSCGLAALPSTLYSMPFSESQERLGVGWRGLWNPLRTPHWLAWRAGMTACSYLAHTHSTMMGMGLVWEGWHHSLATGTTHPSSTISPTTWCLEVPSSLQQVLRFKPSVVRIQALPLASHVTWISLSLSFCICEIEIKSLLPYRVVLIAHVNHLE